MSTLAAPTLTLSERAQRAGEQPISHLMHRALAQPQLVSLAAGFVDQHTLPVEAVSTAFQALVEEVDVAQAALQYGTTPGYRLLREAVLARFLAADGLTREATGLDVDRVVLTAGSNQLLHAVCDALLDPGDIVLCGAPTYFVFLGILSNLGARAVGVPQDEHGLIPEALEAELERLERAGDLPRVKLIYVVSYFDNPSSVTLSSPRRAALVELAQRWSRHVTIRVIDDAAYRDLRYAGPDLPSLLSNDEEGETVILAQTFSKSFSPGVRVGYGILPKSLVKPVCDQKGNLDFGSPNFAQHLMSKVFELGLLDAHVETLKAAYSHKLAATLAALEREFADVPGARWHRPQGGIYVWLELPESIDSGPDGALFDLAIHEGVLYVPGQYAYPAEGARPKRNMIRLSFGVPPAERVVAGVEALARAVRKVQSR